jgi:DNA polymerase-1
LVLGAAFYDGKDFHTEMTNLVRELVPEWDLHGEEPRSAGKTLNFAVLYQMGEYALARKLGCPVETARKIIAAYWSRASTGARYIRRVLKAAKKRGYVQTYFGRRRYCPEYQSLNGSREAHEIEKTIWHMHNAGTAAEYLKLKQLEAWEALRSAGFKPEDVRLSLNMFDETIWHVRDGLLQEVREVIEPVWNQRVVGFLPFRSEVKSGKSWKEVS